MEKPLKGTQTEKNLMAAFAGEAQARNRYTYFAKVAQKEGYVQIALIFEQTAENELSHAKQFFRLLQGGKVEITATYDADPGGDTATNLRLAAEGEAEESERIYPRFAKVAREEGFVEAARFFEHIARVERFHETRFRALLKNVENGRVFKRESPVKWHCIKCGYVMEGTTPPEKCPACSHPTGWFEVLAENY